MFDVEENKRKYCKLKEDIAVQKANARKKYNQARTTFLSILRMLFGSSLKSLVAAVAADIAAAAYGMAGQIVATYAAAASGSLQRILQKIFGKLLELLMSGPQAIFSLAALPLQQARIHNNNEARLLIDADAKLKNVLRILGKWLSGFEEDVYYRQMQQAIPYIQGAIDGMTDVLNQLDRTEGKSATISNVTVDNIVNNLVTAIEVTAPKSVVVQKLGIDAQAEVAKSKSIATRMKAINDQYRIDKAKLTQEWQDAVNRIRAQVPPSRDITTYLAESDTTTKIEAENTTYKNKLDQLNRKYEIHKLNVQAAATNEVNTKTETYTKLSKFGKRGNQFNNDIDRMKKDLKIMLTDIGEAFLEYKQSQLYTGVTYTSISALKLLIKFFIDISKEIGNAAAIGPGLSVLGAGYMTIKARDMFQKDIDLWKNGKATQIGMVSDLALGNFQLRTASFIISSTVTKSLQDVVNFDENLGTEKELFEAFRERIRNIPDFNGRKNFWGVNDPLSLSDVTQYISLLGKIGIVITSAPLAIASPSKSEKFVFKSKLLDVKNAFDKLMFHNSTVNSVLMSYDPPQYAGLPELQRMLAKVTPVLYLALVGLSVAEFATALVNSIYVFGSDKIDCKKYATTQDEQDATQNASEILEKANDENISVINNSPAALTLNMESIDKYDDARDAARNIDIKTAMTSGVAGKAVIVGNVSPAGVIHTPIKADIDAGDKEYSK